FWKKPAEDEGHLPGAFFTNGLRHVVDNNGPVTVRVPRGGGDVPAFVGRGLIIKITLPGPAVLVGLVSGKLQRPFGAGLVSGPRGGKGRVGVLGGCVHKGDP